MYTVGDLSNDSQVATETTMIIVRAVNTAPQILLNVDDGDFHIQEDSTLYLSDIQIVDHDADEVNGATIQVNLTVSHGGFNLPSIKRGGLWLLTGADAENVSHLAIRGSLSVVNNVFGAIAYSPYENWYGTDVLEIFVDDLGNSGKSHDNNSR